LALPLSNNSLQAGNTPQHAGRNSLFKILSFWNSLKLPLSTKRAINTLASIAKSKKATDAARVSACVALLDRGWGKPDKTHHHDGDSRQHIISDRPLNIRPATDAR